MHNFRTLININNIILFIFILKINYNSKNLLISIIYIIIISKKINTIIYNCKV